MHRLWDSANLLWVEQKLMLLISAACASHTWSKWGFFLELERWFSVEHHVQDGLRPNNLVNFAIRCEKKELRRRRSIRIHSRSAYTRITMILGQFLCSMVANLLAAMDVSLLSLSYAVQHTEEHMWETERGVLLWDEAGLGMSLCSGGNLVMVFLLLSKLHWKKYSFHLKLY